MTDNKSGLVPTYYMPMKNITAFNVEFSAARNGGGIVQLTRYFTKEEIGLINDIIRTFKGQ